MHTPISEKKKDAPSGTALRLGECLAEARGQALADVAAACTPPTTAQTIGRLETGMRQLSLTWMNRIAAALGVEPASLMRLETAAPAQTVPAPAIPVAAPQYTQPDATQAQPQPATQPPAAAPAAPAQGG